MIACLDVDYRENEAIAACVLFEQWHDEEPYALFIEQIDDIAPYEPGQFYKRELPCLMRVLKQVSEPIDVIVIDGYVWLDENMRPGLGGHLYEALEQRVPIVGVAKTNFATAESIAEKVYRGDSERPLYVTAVGVDAPEIATQIQAMHGEYRIPTLLKRVDQLCRNS